MNSPKVREELLYPKSILLFLGISSLLFLIIDFYMMVKVPVYGLFFGLFLYLSAYFHGYSFAINSESLLVGIIILFLQFLFFSLMLFYTIRWIREWYQKRKKITTDESPSNAEDLNARNFFSYQKNGIAVYHIFTLTILLIHFLLGQIYLYREATYFERTGFDSNLVYVLPAVTFITLLLTTVALIFLKERISLQSLTYLLNRIMILLLFFAYTTLLFTDTEGFFLAGTVLTYPLLYLAIVRLYQFSSVDSEQSLANAIPKTIIIIFASSMVMIILALLGFMASVSDYNMFPHDGPDLPLINLYTKVYFTIMVLSLVVTYFLLRKSTLQQTQRILYRVFPVVCILFFSIFVYDDWYFNLNDFGREYSILFLGGFLLTQFPVSILIGVIISYVLKLSTYSTNQVEVMAKQV